MSTTPTFNNPPIQIGDTVDVVRGFGPGEYVRPGKVVEAWPAHRCGPWSASIDAAAGPPIVVFADQVIGNRAYDPTFAVRIRVTA